ncbi:response regulator transcription factor [Lentzea atacamensis]|uniref:response regulator transcription factor n=1 Tax=Lentzea atacamensis TaxID=531938 RepID=UPI0038991CA9
MLRLVAAGHTNPEIGAELNLSVNTVKTYLRTVMQKLAARNRAQLIANARGQGLLWLRFTTPCARKRREWCRSTCGTRG